MCNRRYRRGRGADCPAGAVPNVTPTRAILGSMRRWAPILAVLAAVAAGATALAAGRLIPQQSPAAARLASLAQRARLAWPNGRASRRRTGGRSADGEAGAPRPAAHDPRADLPRRPAVHWRIWTTVPKAGYLLEQITSLGTHTGTHISAPCHFHVAPRASSASRSGSSPRVRWSSSTCVPRSSGGTATATSSSGSPTCAGSRASTATSRPAPTWCSTPGLSRFYHLGNTRRPGPYNDYFDDVPGFSGAAVDWLFDQRHILGVGADTFGPDATFDANFAATTEATGRGGITLENLGAGLGSMRAFGDWIEVNGPRFPGPRRAPRVQRRADGDDRLHRLAVASRGGVSVD